MRGSTFVLVLCVLSVPVSLAAEDSPYSIVDMTLTVAETKKSVALPCAPSSWQIEDDMLYGVCAEGLLLVSISDRAKPVAVEVVHTDDPAQKLFKVGDQTWVSTPTGSRPLKNWKQKPPIESKAPEPEPEEPKIEEPKPEVPKPEVPEPEDPITEPLVAVGKVIAVEPGFAIVDFGLERSVGDGDHVEFFRTERVDLGGGEVVQKDRSLSVGKIETISAKRAKVKLGLNEIVDVGAGARTTDRATTGRTLSPRRVGALVETSFVVRPFLALGTLGSGAIIDGSVSYRFASPFALEFFLQPLGFGIAERGNILTFAGNVFGSYDTTAFQVGLGVGATKINNSFSNDRDYVLKEPTYRAGLSIAQIARLGSRDGLHLRVLNNFVLENEEFGFGGITAEAFVPLEVFVDNAWFLVRGGGGVPGHIFGETGLRLLARGNGGKGSVYFTATVGFGNITGETYSDCEVVSLGDGEYRPLFTGESRGEGMTVDGACRDEFNYGGPLVGFGMMWRL